MPLPTSSALWRISNYADLSGEGGLRADGRWHTRGHRIVYLAASPPGALIEHLANLDMDETELPVSYNLLRVPVSDEIEVEVLNTPDGDAWKRDFAVTRIIGDEWLRSGRTALAEVPSAIMPQTSNYLVNPDHPDVTRVHIQEAMQALHDPRPLRRIHS
jgi:RES domain-containing protein